MQRQGQALRAIVHNVVLNERRWRDAVLQALVETVFFYTPSYSLTSLDSIAKAISTEFKFEFDGIEVAQAVEALARKSIIRTQETWTLTERRVDEISKQINDEQKLESRVKEEWLAELKSKYPDVGATAADTLWGKLIDRFVGRLFLRLGGECSQIVGGKAALETQTYADLLSECAAELEDYGLRTMVLNEFPAFFLPVSEDRTRYLMGLLDYTLMQYSIGLDKNALDAIYDKPMQFIIFLDTNFLFSLSGLSQTAFSDVPRLLLEVSKRLRKNITVKFYFTDVTQSEYIRTIDSHVISLSGVRWTSDLSRAALKCGELSGLTEAYHTHNAKSSIDPEVFFGRYRNPLALFKNMGIDIYRQKFFGMKQTQPVIDDIYQFKEYLDKLESPRQWETMEHDVLLWHITTQMRSPADSFAEAKYFVLTHDYRFTRFDSYKQRQLGYKTPVCMFPNHFFQVLRFLMPRSDDFEKGFLQSLRLPLVRPAHPDSLRACSRILQTLALYADLPEKVACDILSDQALANEVTKVVDEREKVIELIDTSLGNRLRSLQSESELLQAREKATAQQKESLEASVQELSSVLRQSTAETKRILGERDHQISELSAKIAAMEDREQRVIVAEETRKADRRIIGRALWLLAGLLAFGVLGAYFLSHWLSLPKVDTRSYYYVLFASALVTWYVLLDKTGVTKTAFWSRWKRPVKRIAIALLTLSSLWQIIALLLSLFSR